uniref:Uncharacterized protein n=1 Tax=viral metagenome TaxID=1070528 RepID=A0A6C0C8S7_9ZZZZ
MNDFCTEKQTPFKINGVEYVMYNHILKTMEIFNVLTDCENDYVEIKWNISSETINMLLHVINDKKYELINSDNDLAHHLEIIRFVEYLGLEKNILKGIINNMFERSIIDYIDKCLDMDYDDNMMLIFDLYDDWYLAAKDYDIVKMFKIFIDKITSSHFPIKFREKVIKEIVSIDVPDCKKLIKMSRFIVNAVVDASCDLFDCQNDKYMIKENMNTYLDERGYNNIFQPDMKKVTEFLVDLIAELLLRRDITETPEKTKNQYATPNYCNVNDFCAEKQTRFKINNIEYVLYDHIIKEMSIFDTSQHDKILELEWDALPERINLAFHIINDKKFELVAPDGYQFKFLDIIKCMKYMGVSEDIMYKTIDYMTSDHIVSYIYMCKTIKYDDEMMYIFNNKDFSLYNGDRPIPKEFESLFDAIMIPHFPIEFQRKVIQKMIMNIQWHIYTNLDQPTIENETKKICTHVGLTNLDEITKKISQQIIDRFGVKRNYCKHDKEIKEIKANYLTTLLLNK